jgi:GxxExxY protein
VSSQEAMRAKQREYRDPGRAADEIAHAVIGAAIEVHRRLGPGHVERVYERALALELEHRGIPFQLQVPLEVRYRDVIVGEFFADLIVGEWVVVELKAVDSLSRYHTVQALSYLTLTELPLALLINFNVTLLKDGIRRIVPPLP